MENLLEMNSENINELNTKSSVLIKFLELIESETSLTKLFEKDGSSDKHYSGYNFLYELIFDKIRYNNLNYLEIGLGTLMPHIPSTHIGQLSRNTNYTPGSILKTYKEYFTNSNIYGIDVAEDCMYSEERIKTFLLDSRDKSSCDESLGDLKFDVILDDGLHTAEAQFRTFNNFFDRLNVGGYYIIEDIGGSSDPVGFYEEYKNELKEVIDQHEYYLDWNVLIIRKNNSKRGVHFGEWKGGDWEYKYDTNGMNTFYQEIEPNYENNTLPMYYRWFNNDNQLKKIKVDIEFDKISEKSESDKKIIYLEKENSYLRDEIKSIKELLTKININNIPNFEVNKNLTIVTGLWNIGRPGRDFSHYIEHFKNFLDIPQNLFIYIPEEYEYLVWQKRSKENTFVKIYELEDVKKIYNPFWDKTQEIRNSSNWLNQAGWLSGSPQGFLEYYNPIVQSKMFMLNDVTIWNPFNTEYFFWLDAGITNTVPCSHFVENNVLNKLTEIGNPFLFLSYPYEANTEIHGFTFSEMNRIANTKVEYVCRGGLFGGHKQQINEANSTYYSMLMSTLSRGFMGTEESIFTLMSYLEPHIYKRFELDGNGLIVKFTQAIINNKIEIIEPKVTQLQNYIKYTDRDVEKVKTNLYILTFNFPEQVLHTIESMKKTPEWLIKPHLVLLDNSTTEEIRNQNRKIAEDYNFEYISLEGNTGICGGRQAAAEHFNDSNAEFMFFFEDDMTSNPPDYDGQLCRNGFRKYVPNLYNLVHRIMLKEKFDFLKLSFTEVYFDNDKQCSWYNVPQHIRTRDWPHYDKLPISGLDPNVPLTNFRNIRNVDGLSYIDGEVYYANWPMIVSKEGNYKMFIETKWAHPFEQTWMSHIYQLTKEGKIKPAILLASPIWHDRIKHYQPNERREN